MPTYQNFKNSPNHLYSAMQDTLAQGLNRTTLLQQQTSPQASMNTMEAQQSAWK